MTVDSWALWVTGRSNIDQGGSQTSSAMIRMSAASSFRLVKAVTELSDP